MLPYVLGAGAVVTLGSYVYLKSLTIRSSWRFDDIPDQSGKIVVCTGANSGIGFHFCRHMVRKKAHVIMGCRSAEKGEEALEAIKKEFPQGSVEVRVVDVSSKKSVQDFAKGIMSDFSRLDCLNNNAGVMMAETFLSDGVDNTFATNNFGPFLLTGLLLPMMEKTPGARIVTVASGAHRRAQRLPWDRLNDPKLNTLNHKAERYNISKAGNILFTRKLAKLLKQNGSQVIAVACHPGWSVTGLQEKVDNGFAAFLTTKVLNPLLGQNAEMGSAPLLLAATGPNVKSGEYYGPCGARDMTGWPALNEVYGLANDESFGDEMWKHSEDWTNFKYKF